MQLSWQWRVGLCLLTVGAGSCLGSTRGSTGRVALVLGLGGLCACCLGAWLLWSWPRQPPEDQDDTSEVEALRAELEQLRAQQTTTLAVAAALPPLPAPGWDPSVPAAPAAASTSPGLFQNLLDFGRGGGSASPAGANGVGGIGAQGLPTTAPAAAPSVSAQNGRLEVIARIQETLVALSQSSALNPAWSRQFWQWISQLEREGFLDGQLLRLLQGFGYVGADSVSGINVEAMKAALSASAATPISLNSAIPAPGAGTLLANTASWTGAAEDQYNRGLPADLQRAAVEIYRSIRNEGVGSVRQWVKDNYTGYRGPGATTWVDLWSQASQIDIALGQCANDAAIIQLLSTDDRLEVALRHIGAFFYEMRTKDRVGASRMRAVGTPGITRDIMPKWSVDEATAFSKAEYQRSERVESEIRRRNRGGGKPDGGGRKGKGKGKGKDQED